MSKLGKYGFDLDDPNNTCLTCFWRHDDEDMCETPTNWQHPLPWTPTEMTSHIPDNEPKNCKQWAPRHNIQAYQEVVNRVSKITTLRTRRMDVLTSAKCSELDFEDLVPEKNQKQRGIRN